MLTSTDDPTKHKFAVAPPGTLPARLHGCCVFWCCFDVLKAVVRDWLGMRMERFHFVRFSFCQGLSCQLKNINALIFSQNEVIGQLPLLNAVAGPVCYSYDFDCPCSFSSPLYRYWVIWASISFFSLLLSIILLLCPKGSMGSFDEHLVIHIVFVPLLFESLCCDSMFLLLVVPQFAISRTQLLIF